MRRRWFTEGQIIAILKEGEAGTPVAEICRQHGISQPTYHRWKAKCGGMDVSDAKRLKELEEENRRLKQLVADQALDIQTLRLVAEKKW